jgi:hypothetical protein
VSAVVRHSEQFYRLVEQALPPHFPVIRLPQGDILIALDTMMSAFFSNKIQGLIKNMNEKNSARPGAQPGFSATVSAFLPKLGRGRLLDVDAILKQKTTTCSDEPTKALGGVRA